MRDDLIKTIVDKNGKEVQIKKAIEELDELKSEMINVQDGNDNVRNIMQEVVDVSVIIKELIYIYDFDLEMLSALSDYKLLRTLYEMRQNEKESKE